MAVVHRGQRLVDLRFARADVLRKVVHVAHACVGDVECAVGDDGVFLGRNQQIEQLLADLHGTRRGLGVDLGHLAGGLVGAHGLIDVAHFIEQRIDRLFGLGFVLRP